MTDIPAPPTPTSSRFGWLRRRFLRLPVWAWIVIVLVIGGAASGGSPSKETSNQTPTEESTPVKATEAPPTEVPPTEVPPTEAPPTTEDPGDRRDIELLLTVGVLREGEARLNLIKAIEDDFILERIDVWTADLGDDDFTFRVEGASGYNSAEYQIEKAWELVSVLGMFWESDGMLRNDVGTIKPSLTVVVDGRAYVAPYELMVRLAERSVTQSEWMSLAEA